MLVLEKFLARVLWLVCCALGMTSEDVERARAREQARRPPDRVPEQFEA